MKVLKFFIRLTDFFVLIPMWFYTGVLVMADIADVQPPSWMCITCASISIGSAIAWGILVGVADAKVEEKKEEKTNE